MSRSCDFWIMSLKMKLWERASVYFCHHTGGKQKTNTCVGLLMQRKITWSKDNFLKKTEQLRCSISIIYQHIRPSVRPSVHPSVLLDAQMQCYFWINTEQCLNIFKSTEILFSNYHLILEGIPKKKVSHPRVSFDARYRLEKWRRKENPRMKL